MAPRGKSEKDTKFKKPPEKTMKAVDPTSSQQSSSQLAIAPRTETAEKPVTSEKSVKEFLLEIKQKNADAAAATNKKPQNLEKTVKAIILQAQQKNGPAAANTQQSSSQPAIASRTETVEKPPTSEKSVDEIIHRILQNTAQPRIAKPEDWTIKNPWHVKLRERLDLSCAYPMSYYIKKRGVEKFFEYEIDFLLETLDRYPDWRSGDYTLAIAVVFMKYRQDNIKAFKNCRMPLFGYTDQQIMAKLTDLEQMSKNEQQNNKGTENNDSVQIDKMKAAPDETWTRVLKILEEQTNTPVAYNPKVLVDGPAKPGYFNPRNFWHAKLMKRLKELCVHPIAQYVEMRRDPQKYFEYEIELIREVAETYPKLKPTPFPSALAIVFMKHRKDNIGAFKNCDMELFDHTVEQLRQKLNDMEKTKKPKMPTEDSGNDESVPNEDDAMEEEAPKETEDGARSSMVVEDAKAMPTHPDGALDDAPDDTPEETKVEAPARSVELKNDGNRPDHAPDDAPNLIGNGTRSPIQLKDDGASTQKDSAPDDMPTLLPERTPVVSPYHGYSFLKRKVASPPREEVPDSRVAKPEHFEPTNGWHANLMNRLKELCVHPMAYYVKRRRLRHHKYFEYETDLLEEVLKEYPHGRPKQYSLAIAIVFMKHRKDNFDALKNCRMPLFDYTFEQIRTKMSDMLKAKRKKLAKGQSGNDDSVQNEDDAMEEDAPAEETEDRTSSSMEPGDDAPNDMKEEPAEPMEPENGAGLEEPTPIHDAPDDSRPMELEEHGGGSEENGSNDNAHRTDNPKEAIDWFLSQRDTFTNCDFRFEHENSDEVLEYFLDKVENKVTGLLTINVAASEGFRYTFRQPRILEHVQIQNGSWVTVNHLCKLNARILRIEESRLTCGDMNCYLRNWISGGNSNLRYLNLQLQFLDVNTLFNRFGAIRRRNHLNPIDYIVTNELGIRFDKSYEFKRSDGTIASIVMRNGGFTMCVWPDSKGKPYPRLDVIYLD